MLHRRRGLRGNPADRLQPLPRVQALRGGLPGGGDLAGRPLRLLRVPNAQLPGVHGRLRATGSSRSPRARTHSSTAGGSSDQETASMWQSLAFGPNYKAAYCLAVCPAGEDVIGPFLADRGGFVAGGGRPLAAEGGDRSTWSPDRTPRPTSVKKFPHKRPVRVGSGRRPRTVRDFLRALPHVFQRHQAEGLAATYHFTFTGREPSRRRSSSGTRRSGSRRATSGRRPRRAGRQRDLDRLRAQGEEPRLGIAPAEDRPQGDRPGSSWRSASASRREMERSRHDRDHLQGALPSADSPSIRMPGTSPGRSPGPSAS